MPKQLSVKEAKANFAECLRTAEQGLPVVITRVGGLPEYSLDEKTGFVIEPKNTNQLCSAIQKILSDDTLRMRMGNFARQHVLDNYTFTAVTKKFITVLESVRK